MRTEKDCRHTDTAARAYKLIPFNGVITADQVVLRSLGAAVTDSTATLRVSIPQNLTAGLRSMLPEYDIDSDVKLRIVNLLGRKCLQ